MKAEDCNNEHRFNVWLIGSGIVGRAIARAHLHAGVPFSLADMDEGALASAVQELQPASAGWNCVNVASPASDMSAVRFHDAEQPISTSTSRPLIVESIVERLETKRQFFRNAEIWFGDEAVLCSNTSTLTIRRLSDEMKRPHRLCGMHFFMPVHQREAVEVIPSQFTKQDVAELCCQHVRQLSKRPLLVADGPGFVVNRMLSPYLNQAMLLVTQGATAGALERAALEYGMPMSPLELVDLIGARTAFDGGRVYWQAFPERIDAAPLLPAMVKRKRLGRANGEGFYSYLNGRRSTDLAQPTLELAESYSRDKYDFSSSDLLELLTVPMWIEAACVLRDGIVGSRDEIELAMRGGLGFSRVGGWFDHFRKMGLQRIRNAISKWSATHRAMRPPNWLDALLQNSPNPDEVMIGAAGRSRESVAGKHKPSPG